MSRTFHMKLSIRGFLLNCLSARDLSSFTHNDGRPMTRGEAVDSLIDHIRKGDEFIPTTGCDNFDPKRGCRGHAPKLSVIEGSRP